MNKNVCLVVTYNRLKFLKKNIESLLNQTINDFDILIINNNSTDETEEYILSIPNKRIKYYNTGANLGGAGGFAYGVEKALTLGYDYAWLMDDDAIPHNDAFESLIKKAEKIDYKFSFIGSYVEWKDFTPSIMNIPGIIDDKIKMLDCLSKLKMIPISASSFVGFYVNLKYAEKAGLPIAEFFIYGDDVEYSRRLNKYAPAYLDLDSIITHECMYNEGADIVTVDHKKLDRYIYQSRNAIYLARQDKKRAKRFITICKRIIKIIIKSPDFKLKRIFILLKGSFKGLFFYPKIKYVKKNNIEG